MQPRERVDLAVERWGTDRVMRAIGATLRLRPDDPVDGELRELAILLGEREADPSWTAGGSPPHAYWAQVWSARALLYLWDDDVASDVVAALGHTSWRVREMALKVVAAREIGCADVLGPLASDDVPRVRAALARALGKVRRGRARTAAPTAGSGRRPGGGRAGREGGGPASAARRPGRPLSSGDAARSAPTR